MRRKGKYIKLLLYDFSNLKLKMNTPIGGWQK